MNCIIEKDNKEYWIPKFDDGSAQAQVEEEIIRKANDWKVTTSIIFGMIGFIGLVVWFAIAMH